MESPLGSSEGQDSAAPIAVVVGVVEDHAEVVGSVAGHAGEGDVERLGGEVRSDGWAGVPEAVAVAGAGEGVGVQSRVGAPVEASPTESALWVDGPVQLGSRGSDQGGRCSRR